MKIALFSFLLCFPDFFYYFSACVDYIRDGEIGIQEVCGVVGGVWLRMGGWTDTLAAGVQDYLPSPTGGGVSLRRTVTRLISYLINSSSPRPLTRYIVSA